MTRRKSSDADAGAGAGKRHYKLWVLAAIVLVALWSMFTGSITLKWSAGNLNHFSDDLDSMILEDIDVLEVEEREKVVRHMWNVYTRPNPIRLPQFWSEAFQAAYEQLVSDVRAIRDAAVSEIAKMSLRSHISHQLPPQLQSQSHVQSIKRSRKIKEAKSSMNGTVDSKESFLLLMGGSQESQ